MHLSFFVTPTHSNTSLPLPIPIPPPPQSLSSLSSPLTPLPSISSSIPPSLQPFLQITKKAIQDTGLVDEDIANIVSATAEAVQNQAEAGRDASFKDRLKMAGKMYTTPLKAFAWYRANVWRVIKGLSTLWQNESRSADPIWIGCIWIGCGSVASTLQ